MTNGHDISLGRPTTASTTKQCTKRETASPATMDGRGGAAEMAAMLKSDAAYLMAIADVLEWHFQFFGQHGFRDAMLGVVGSMRARAGRIDALLAQTRGEEAHDRP